VIVVKDANGIGEWVMHSSVQVIRNYSPSRKEKSEGKIMSLAIDSHAGNSKKGNGL